MKLPFINLSIDLSQNLTPEPCLTKTLSDIIKSQLQQSLNPKVSIALPIVRLSSIRHSRIIDWFL